jgi:hypothetical protein
MLPERTIRHQISRIAVGTVLVVCGIAWPSTAAWSACTTARHAELTSYGYMPKQIDRICRESEPPRSEAPAGQSQKKGKNPEAVASTPTQCHTNYGICPLVGEPESPRCYCQFWGDTFTGNPR